MRQLKGNFNWVIENALVFWNARTFFEKILIALPIFFIIASITGME